MLFTDDLLSCYRDLARHPELRGGWILEAEGGVTCESDWSVRNLSTRRRALSVCWQRVLDGGVTAPRSAPLPDHTELTSRSGGSAAWLVQSGGNGAEEPVTRYITVHQPGLPPNTIDLAKTKLHGKVYTDGELGCLEFSPDGALLAFVAEERRPTACSLLDPPGGEQDAAGRAEQFLRLPDWGEQFTGKHRSVVVVVRTGDTNNSDGGRRVFTPPPHYAGVGQLQWAGRRGLVGVAYIDRSPRLGLIYCRTREAVLFYLDLEGGVFKELTPRGWWVGSPRISPDLSCLVYLRGGEGGTHVRGAALLCRPWGESPVLDQVDPRVVVPIHPSAVPLPDGSLFAGLTGSTTLPRRCFLAGGTRVALAAQGLLSMQGFTVHLDTGAIRSLVPGAAPSTAPAAAPPNVAPLDCAGDLVLYGVEDLQHTPTLVLAGVQVVEGEIEVTERCRLMEGMEVVKAVAEGWVLPQAPPHPDPRFDAVPVGVMYCGPVPGDGPPRQHPVVLYPHGGPHSAAYMASSLALRVLVQRGYGVVLPQYRGSLGAGEDGVRALPGHVGDVDVRDCHAAVVDCLERHSTLDRKNVYLFGGSHGGYLVTSLSARYPEFYRAVSSRNPVTDIATMAGVTDIPDWTHVESGTVQLPDEAPAATGAQSPSTAAASAPPAPTTLVLMAAASPLWSIDSVTAPTLMLLGEQDRRVPPSQGIKYHEMLRHRGVKTRLHVYPDCHPLSKVEHEADSLMRTIAWFEEHRAE